MSTGVTAGRVLARSVNLPGIGVVVGLLAVWQLVIQVGLLELAYLPAPSAIVAQGIDLVSSGELLTDLAHTLRTTVIATGLATVAGAGIGLAVGLSSVVRDYSSSSIDFFRTIPVTALVPAALLVWGPSDTAEIAVATYAATWPILINTVGGVRAMPARLHDVARVMRMSRARSILRIVVPAAVHSIVVGIRLGAVTGLVLAIVAEMLINPIGLGWGIVQAQNALQPEQLWAYTITAGVLAYVLNLALVWLVRRALPGSVVQSQGVTS